MLYSGMPFSTNVIRLLEDIEPSLRKVLIAILEEIERQREETVTRKEFLEFARHTDENFQKVWKSIHELAEAQKRTERRVDELAEAQKRTEARVEELAEAQKKTEQRVDSLAQKVEELAEAQKKTEQRVDSLAQKVEELAEAQKKTEEEIRRLARGLKNTREMVAGLSDSVGYTLEDRIFPYIREFVLKEYGVKAKILDRRNIIYPDGGFDEANIYVEGRRNGEKVYVIGECKARPGKKDIKKFNEAIKRIKAHLGGKVEAFFVGYYYSPEIEKYLRDKHPEIMAMKSFEFELKYGKKA